ncbi:MAG: hypothetical protein WAO83_20805 [Fuerstiella sp.]|jgi:hypothetical protein
MSGSSPVDHRFTLADTNGAEKQFAAQAVYMKPLGIRNVDDFDFTIVAINDFGL